MNVRDLINALAVHGPDAEVHVLVAGRYRRVVETESEAIGGGDRSKGDPIRVLLVLDDDDDDGEKTSPPPV